MFVVGSMLMVGTPLVQRGKKCHNSWSNEVAWGRGVSRSEEPLQNKKKTHTHTHNTHITGFLAFEFCIKNLKILFFKKLEKICQIYSFKNIIFNFFLEKRKKKKKQTHQGRHKWP
jgi:hypothetical protein